MCGFGLQAWIQRTCIRIDLRGSVVVAQNGRAFTPVCPPRFLILIPTVFTPSDVFRIRITWVLFERDLPASVYIFCSVVLLGESTHDRFFADICPRDILLIFCCSRGSGLKQHRSTLLCISHTCLCSQILSLISFPTLRSSQAQWTLSNLSETTRRHHAANKTTRMVMLWQFILEMTQ